MQPPEEVAHPQPRSGSVVPLMSGTPARGFVSNSRLMLGPQEGPIRDWESFALAQAMGQRQEVPAPVMPTLVKREGSPSVAEFAPAVAHAQEYVRTPRPVPVRRGVPGQVEVDDRPMHLLDHQAYLEWRREEYARRMEAEARGEAYIANRPYSEDFVRTLPGGGDPSSLMSIDFQRRSRNLQVQVVGTREELAWVNPPAIPTPVGWNGYWDLCAGHEQILQVMAVSGATPENSPSLTQHFMYPELLSCFQRLQYGTYMVLFQKGEPPHERYFYTKPMPLANRAQYCPYFCWSLHRHAHQAIDCIPLCNVMWVTQGVYESSNFRRYLVGGDYIAGPQIGKRRAEMLIHGCFTVWFYDGKDTKGIDILAPDPLVFTMWMKLLEDMAQLNAALDVSGSVKAEQRRIERMRDEGELEPRGLSTSHKAAILR